MADPIIGDLERMPRDSEDFPYYVSVGVAYRASKCCGCPVTYFDETLCCKKCYEEVDPASDSEASVTTALGDATLAEPARGPHLYTLPKEDTSD